MTEMFDIRSARGEAGPLLMAVVGGFACALALGKALPLTMNAISAAVEPLCMASEAAGSALDTVEPITSHALPNVPGKPVPLVRVFYGPGGFTPAHPHAGPVTAPTAKAEIPS